MNKPTVSVLMPTYRQASFLTRSLRTLFAQTFEDWELIVIDDGSPDETAEVLAQWQNDRRVRTLRLPSNRGLGVALNRGMAAATADLIAYLPSDDIWSPDHLESLVETMHNEPKAVLAYSGVRRSTQEPGNFNIIDLTSAGQIKGFPLQLLQVIHRRITDHWMERKELVTDDLDRMFWAKLRPHGEFVGTGRITCEWVDHPHQRHKIVREPLGGINPYRAWYGPKEPLRFHTTVGSPIDEVQHYGDFRARKPIKKPGGLRIVLAGALAFYPERVLALAEQGHELFGLWAPKDMHWFNTVGPVPFGHVKDIPNEGWQTEIARIKPDVIYGLLNYQVVPFVHQVMTHTSNVPFVWHFKEGPFDCITNGTWPLLVDLFTRSDGQIYTSPEQRDWIEAALPNPPESRHSMTLDGDLPPRHWFTENRTPRLSETSGGAHTVMPGQPLGMTTEIMQALAGGDVHLHMYGDFYRTRFGKLIDEMRNVAPDHLHLHGQVNPMNWVSELSRYDAGWLHLLPSKNHGNLQQAQWADLNYPARMSTLACAGLPWIQIDPEDSIVASAELAKKLDIGVFYKKNDDLVAQLTDRALMSRLQANVWAKRDQFTFDFHVDRLVSFFEASIQRRKEYTSSSKIIDLTVNAHETRARKITS